MGEGAEVAQQAPRRAPGIRQDLFLESAQVRAAEVRSLSIPTATTGQSPARDSPKAAHVLLNGRQRED